MNRVREFSKALAALATTILIAIQAPISDGKIELGEWIAIGIAVAGTYSVYKVENAPPATKIAQVKRL
jgi:hypothetical protein